MMKHAPLEDGTAPVQNIPPSPEPMGTGLSARLFALTLLFVLLGGILLFIPVLADFRNGWLGDRLAQARTAALILEKAPPDSLPKSLVAEMLAGMETTTIALRIDQSRQLLAMSDMPPMVDFEIDLRNDNPVEDILGALDTLIFGGNRAIRVVGPAPIGAEFVEIVIPERSMRAAMLAFSRNILLVTLLLSLLTAGLIYGTLNALIIRPVRHIAQTILRFSAMPSDATTLLKPGTREDEIGALERALTRMQHILQQHLRQRERLANLGLAVAKINHDLRNMLASAQLMADRLNMLPDPDVQRFMPKLFAALDRAITFCQSTLAYGKAQERAANIQIVPLRPLVEEAGEMVGLAGAECQPAFTLLIPSDLHVMADAEHLLRVFTNLFRNALAVLPPVGGAVSVEAVQHGADILIHVRDNGPGIPAMQQASLFEAFAQSTKVGGTGLGLTITRELMQAMGGTIALEATQTGTSFRLILPGGAGPV
jgi:signal transduction histidine kinase